VAVNAEDQIAGLETGPLGRRTGSHLPDPGRIHGMGQPGQGEHREKNENGEKQVEQRPGNHYPETLPHGFMGKGAMPLGRIDFLVIRLFTEHLDVTAKRKNADKILGITPFFTHDLTAEAQGKGEHLDPEHLGDKEMAQFMDKNKDAENNDKRDK